MSDTIFTPEDEQDTAYINIKNWLRQAKECVEHEKPLSAISYIEKAIHHLPIISPFRKPIP